jgi:hypothetical protein
MSLSLSYFYISALVPNMFGQPEIASVSRLHLMSTRMKLARLFLRLTRAGVEYQATADATTDKARLHR